MPWWFAKQVPGRLLPRRWQPLLKVWAVGVVAAAIVHAVHAGRLFAIVLTGLAVTDLSIRGIRGRRQRRLRRRSPLQLQAAGAAARTMPSPAQAA